MKGTEVQRGWSVWAATLEHDITMSANRIIAVASQKATGIQSGIFLIRQLGSSARLLITKGDGKRLVAQAGTKVAFLTVTGATLRVDQPLDR